MTIISSVLIADRRLIGVMNMTLEEKINRLREATEKYRKNTNAEPQNSFEAEAKKVEEHEAEKNKQLADWLEELKRYKDLEEQGRLLVLPETPEDKGEIDKVDWSAMQKALEEYEERVKQEEENAETNNESKDI